MTRGKRPPAADVEVEVDDPTIPRTDAPKAPMRVISMKTPNAGTKKVARPVPEVRLFDTPMRAQTPAPPVGRLAPPRDPHEVRSRRVYDVILWGSLAVMLAAAVTLVIWLLAGR